MEPAVILSSFIQLPAAAEKIVFASMTLKQLEKKQNGTEMFQ